MPSSGVNRAAIYGNSPTQGGASRASIVSCATLSARGVRCGLTAPSASASPGSWPKRPHNVAVFEDRGGGAPDHEPGGAAQADYALQRLPDLLCRRRPSSVAEGSDLAVPTRF
jgi:hypothetical protein